MTYQPKSEFLREIIARGFLADCTDLQGLDEALIQGPVTCYIGYDATARSLHVGHLLNIMLLRWWQKTGNRPITLMGGGTTKVGDPSFPARRAPLLTARSRSTRISAGIAARLCSTVTSGMTRPPRGRVLNNAEWLDGLNYHRFPLAANNTGRHFLGQNRMGCRSSREISGLTANRA